MKNQNRKNNHLTIYAHATVALTHIAAIVLGALIIASYFLKTSGENQLKFANGSDFVISFIFLLAASWTILFATRAIDYYNRFARKPVPIDEDGSTYDKISKLDEKPEVDEIPELPATKSEIDSTQSATEVTQASTGGEVLNKDDDSKPYPVAPPRRRSNRMGYTEFIKENPQHAPSSTRKSQHEASSIQPANEEPDQSNERGKQKEITTVQAHKAKSEVSPHMLSAVEFVLFGGSVASIVFLVKNLNLIDVLKGGKSVDIDMTTVHSIYFVIAAVTALVVSSLAIGLYTTCAKRSTQPEFTLEENTVTKHDKSQEQPAFVNHRSSLETTVGK